MSERWTDKKRGFIGDQGNLMSGVNTLSLNRFMREILGELNQTQVQTTTLDGTTRIQGFGKYEKVTFDPVIKAGKKYMPITIYQPPCEIPYGELAPKTIRYWGVPPTYSLDDVINSLAVVLPAPQRILKSGEAAVIKKMGEKRKVFIFPGTDVAIYNSVLDQIGSIFEVIPFSTVLTGGMYGILPTDELMYLPCTLRGWLRVRDKYASLALAKDAFNKGLAFSNVISVFPAYIYPKGNGGIYETGNVWDTGTIELVEDHWGAGSLGFQLNTLYPSGYSLDPWTSLTQAQTLAWLHNIEGHMPYIKKTNQGYALNRNVNGWVDFTDHALYDWISAHLAYYTGDNILVAGFTPYWLTAAYNTATDTAYTTKRFSKWWAYDTWGAIDRLEQYFYNMPQYFFYDDTYVPPVQS